MIFDMLMENTWGTAESDTCYDRKRKNIVRNETGHTGIEVTGMRIQVVGLNHRQAPLVIRERVAFGPELLEAAYRQVHELRHQEGVVILSTCNRTEIYVAGEVELADILAWWEQLTGVPRGEFSDALLWYQGADAIRHVMRVAAGLDSKVLGETQILGQVKDAYHLAQRYGAVGRLHRVFHYALRAGKRAHAETDISKNALSLGYAIVELTRKVFGNLAPLTAVVIGTGETGELVARHLSAQGIGRLLLVNRTSARAQGLAEELGAEVWPFDNRLEALKEAQVVVSATSAQEPVITADMVRQAIAGHGQALRFFFDLAVPRDVEPEVGQLGENVFLYDIDDVQSVVRANLRHRQLEVAKVERLIEEEVKELENELGASQVGPVIRSLRQKAEAIRQAELAKALNRLPNLSEEEREVVAETTRLILNKFLNDAMVSMRQWGADEAKASYVEAVRELFRLTDEGDVAVTPE